MRLSVSFTFRAYTRGIARSRAIDSFSCLIRFARLSTNPIVEKRSVQALDLLCTQVCTVVRYVSVYGVKRAGCLAESSIA